MSIEKNKKIKVLSLFDGISCGRVALGRVGFTDIEYYSSEIDKYAIQIAQKNYPNTIQLGDVEMINYESGILFDKNCQTHIDKIDLLIGGSPCQGFSFAGKQLNFDDPRSALFFEFVRILKEVKPKYFLLENVRMKQEYQDIISEHLGVKPIMINSSLVSAQNRVRLYWTNIPNIEQPEDKGILLKDILEDEVDEKYYFDKNIGVTIKGKNALNKVRVSLRNKAQKARCLTAGGQNRTNAGATNICEQIGKIDIKGFDSIKRVYSEEGKSPTLTSMQGGHRQPKILENIRVRKLTPIECERLQTLPDNYTEGISNSQRYKALGNGWTVDVITHIFKNMEL